MSVANSSRSRLAHRLAVQPFDLLADDARAVVHDMAERLVFTVQIAHEVFCALGQAQDRLDVDHLRRRRLHGRVFFADQAQIFPVPAAHILLHAIPLLCSFFSLYYVSRIKKRASAKKILRKSPSFVSLFTARAGRAAGRAHRTCSLSRPRCPRRTRTGV